MATEVQLQPMNDTDNKENLSNETESQESMSHSDAAVITANKIDNEDKSDNQSGDSLQNNQNGPSSSVLKGADNPVFISSDEKSDLVEEIPPLTYIDFMPRLRLQSDLKDHAPEFTRFSSLVEQANQWLAGNTEYTAFKCETIMTKLEPTDKILVDSVLYQESAYGTNKFVFGLRLWLLPQSNISLPVVQIGYTTALPIGIRQNDQVTEGTEAGHVVRVSINCSMQETVNTINKQFVKRPIPGAILNVETVTFRRSHETNQKEAIDPDCTCWAENGSMARLYVNALRIYYILGNSEFEKIGFHDQIPEFTQNAVGSAVKFCPYKEVVGRTSLWLQNEKGIRVVNMQSVNVKCDVDTKGKVIINPDSSGHMEKPYTDTKYAKVLRTFYVQSSKMSKEALYSSVNLTSRLFVPVRREGTTKGFESFSKTMQRIIKWMSHTKIPPLCVETIQYQVFLNGYGDVVNPDKVDTNLSRTSGRNLLSTVRLYFPSEFVEPPPEILPEVDTSGEYGWGCVVS